MSLDSVETPRNGSDAASVWRALLAMGGAVLVLSLSFNFYLFNQCLMLKQRWEEQNAMAQEQRQRVAQAKDGFHALIEDVVNFSAKHPEARELLVRHGVHFVDASPQAPPSH